MRVRYDSEYAANTARGLWKAKKNKRLVKALREELRELEASRATLGDRHPDTLLSISNMAGLLQDQGKLDVVAPGELVLMPSRSRLFSLPLAL